MAEAAHRRPATPNHPDPPPSPLSLAAAENAAAMLAATQAALTAASTDLTAARAALDAAAGEVRVTRSQL